MMKHFFDVKGSTGNLLPSWLTLNAMATRDLASLNP